MARPIVEGQGTASRVSVASTPHDCEDAPGQAFTAPARPAAPDESGELPTAARITPALPLQPPTADSWNRSGRPFARHRGAAVFLAAYLVLIVATFLWLRSLPGRSHYQFPHVEEPENTYYLYDDAIVCDRDAFKTIIAPPIAASPTQPKEPCPDLCAQGATRVVRVIGVPTPVGWTKNELDRLKLFTNVASRIPAGRAGPAGAGAAMKALRQAPDMGAAMGMTRGFDYHVRVEFEVCEYEDCDGSQRLNWIPRSKEFTYTYTEGSDGVGQEDRENWMSDMETESASQVH